MNLFQIGSAVFSNALPSFEWQSGMQSRSGIPFLKIQFPNNGEEENIILEQFNPIPLRDYERSEDVDNCIFKGYLQNDPDSTVTLAGGCPFEESFEVGIFFYLILIKFIHLKSFDEGKNSFIYL